LLLIGGLWGGGKDALEKETLEGLGNTWADQNAVVGLLETPGKDNLEIAFRSPEKTSSKREMGRFSKR